MGKEHLLILSVPSGNFCSENALKLGVLYSDGSGSKIFDPGGSIFCSSGLVSNPWFEFGFGKYPLKMSNFLIYFPFGSKKNLFVLGQKSTWVKGGVGLSFTAGQK